jgi:integrase
VSPTKTSKDGSYRFDRYFRGVGRIQVSSGTSNRREFRNRDALLTRLYRKPRLDLLKALKEKRISMTELVEADRLDQLGQTTADLVLRRPLWSAVEALVPKMAKGRQTVRRYKVSLQALAHAGVLSKRAVIQDLERVDWIALELKWGKSSADWNHIGRAVSRFLTVALGDVYHPFRRAIIKQIPRRRERHRVPDVEPKDFRVIVAHAVAPLRPAYWTIAATGARLGELKALERGDLLPRSYAVRLEASKTETEEGDRIVPVSKRLWPWVMRAIPVRVSDWTLRQSWYRACEAAGYPKVRLHDLRHFTGQQLADAGRSEAAIGRFLGQTTPAITRKYTDRLLRREDAEALADRLLPQSVPQRRKAGRK